MDFLMLPKDNDTGFRKILLLGLVPLLFLSAILYDEIKSNEIKSNYKFQNDWICYSKKDKSTNIMHLSINHSLIKENEVDKFYYEVLFKSELNDLITYEIVRNKKKYADIIEIDSNTIEYKNSVDSYKCKLSSKLDHSLDFTGKWIGYLNKSKKDKVSKADISKIKLVVDIEKDSLFIDLASNKDNFSVDKIINFKQEYGLINLDISTKEKQNNKVKFKILSNNEIILINSDINQKETYLRRDTFF